MATLDELDNQLTAAAMLLDAAAGSIRDCPLAPVQEHLRRIGEALANVFDIQKVIYEGRPDLKPGILRDPNEFAAANARLAVALSNAYKLGETGQVDAAARVLKEYIGVEKSDRQRAIAQMILERRTTPDAT